LINGFYAAKSGAKAFQTSLDITANNIANANTQGYKAQSASFTDLVYTNSQGLDVLTGNGVRVAGTSIVTEQAGMQQGGGGFDVAVNGEGFIAVQNGQGQQVYTRAGNFNLSVEGNQLFLTMPGGEYALDQNCQRIQVQSANPEDVRAAFDRVALYTFPNPSALTPLGDGLYAQNAASGQAAADAASSLTESASEVSNVDLTAEITRMMIAQRGMQMNLRMLQTADELEQNVNTLRT
jgi:flagellar basal-body rod protein FlgG